MLILVHKNSLNLWLMGCSSDYQYKRCHSLEFNPILDQHSEIGGVADETVLKHIKSVQAVHTEKTFKIGMIHIAGVNLFLQQKIFSYVSRED
jgi:hypothetical protein